MRTSYTTDNLTLHTKVLFVGPNPLTGEDLGGRWEGVIMGVNPPADVRRDDGSVDVRLFVGPRKVDVVVPVREFNINGAKRRWYSFFEMRKATEGYHRGFVGGNQ